MLALSTSCKSTETPSGRTLLRLLENFQISGLELDYRINQTVYAEIRQALQHSRLKVVSIHNFFPIPPVASTSGGGGDLFLLSHPDEEERIQAVEWTCRSIEHAHDLGARAVVLHCGLVDMDPELEILYHYYEKDQIYSGQAQAFIRKKIKEREKKMGKHLDALLRSLDTLARVAEKKEVLLGLENRYHYHELPGMKEFAVLLQKLEGSPIGYWHDTGHANTNEILTLLPPEALLKEYSDQLIGIHFHDAIGLEDHLCPGSGEIEFNKIKPYLKPDTLLVVELKPGTASADISEGINLLHRLGFDPEYAFDV